MSLFHISYVLGQRFELNILQCLHKCVPSEWLPPPLHPLLQYCHIDAFRAFVVVLVDDVVHLTAHGVAE